MRKTKEELEEMQAKLKLIPNNFPVDEMDLEEIWAEMDLDEDD